MPENHPPSLGLGAEVDSGSKMLDMANTTIGTSLFTFLSLQFRNSAINDRADKEFRGMQEVIKESINHPKTGYLIEVSIFTNEFGNIVIPRAQLLLPIGIGVEPLDAYAEFLRNDNLRSGMTTSIDGLTDSSFFLWVSEEGGALKAWTIAPQFTNYFYKNSMAEARRRDLLYQFKQALPHKPYESVSRALYWTEIEASRIQMIKDETRKREIKTLNSRMQELEKEVNGLYREYQDLAFKLGRQSALSSILGKASILGGIFQDAMKLDELISSKDSTPVSGLKVEPKLKLGMTIELNEERTTTTRNSQENIRRNLRLKVDDMNETDMQLDKIYSEGKVPLPSRSRIIIPELP